MAAALLTAVISAVAGIGMAIYLGLTEASNATLSRHITVGLFSTLLCLLSHSMMMFYFLGKGKAVREAAEEGGLSKEFEHRIALLRKPVFSIGTLAMVVTMITALIGASVDTGMLPAGIHGVLAYSCLALNLFALRVEINALTESGRVVADVDQLLNA
jgi:UDP-N-acetyl-D-mannosaminuronic acid transferase (WecB/TagA/CpsF family)